MSRFHRSSRVALFLTAAILAGCAKKDEAPADTTAAIDTTAATPAPAPINLADVAGKWDVRAVPTTGDTTAATYVLEATSSTSGWTMTFPGRPAMNVAVTTDADSIMVDAGPYSSVLRKGVQVTTHSVSRLVGGNLVGQAYAHYNVKTADSTLTLNTTGTRKK